jgi:aspartyl-tRNA(Asn)/glutamyl-tRNA(Gln) amidotransferase subunit A
VPIAIKDLLNVKGPTLHGGLEHTDGLRGAVRRDGGRAAARPGCTFVARTNTDEFAMGGSTETIAYGPTRIRGSRAVPAVPSAVRRRPWPRGWRRRAGVDTGGSIRQPAAFCGVTGIQADLRTGVSR